MTCFDFSRAGSLGDGTRRRARDRNPQGTGKKIDPRQVMPQPIRPLSANPLRPAGPVRRTCGVIKLPVMLLSPPAGDTGLRDSILGQQGVTDQKLHALNVVVQSLWERRLKGVCPHDHISGKEVTRMDAQVSLPQTATFPTSRPDHTSHSPLLLSTTLQPQQPVLPSLLGTQQPLTGTTLSQQKRNPSPQPGQNKYVHSSSTPTPSSALTGTRLLQVHHQQQQQQLKSLVSTSTPSSTSSSPLIHSSHLPITVTDTDVRLQEQRVQLLRQQLMAAQASL